MNMISADVEQSIAAVQRALGNDPTLVVRRFSTHEPNPIPCAVLYFDGMSDSESISENIIKKIMAFSRLQKKNCMDALLEHAVDASEIKRAKNADDAIYALMSGDCLLLCQGDGQAVIASVKGYMKRSLDEPASEVSAKGPREGFVEPLIHNLAMLRRRLKSGAMRMEYVTFGQTVTTKGAICWLDGVADVRIIDELRRRLKSIEKTDAQDINFIIERIRDRPLSPLRTTGTTERPDVAAAKLLEGRVALVLDGCPSVMTVPFLFIEYFQSPDDYYHNFWYGSYTRAMRILGFLISIGTPALYVSVLVFHQELIPTRLLVSIAAARAGVPFPVVLETFALLIAFEVLRDASVRMSPALGQSLSIVGALVLGEATVSARLISAPLITVVALTGITGLLNPLQKSASIVYRYGLLMLSSLLGVYGLILGFTVLGLQISCTRSFGMPYGAFTVPGRAKGARDTLLRAPWRYMGYGNLFSRAGKTSREEMRK